MGGLAGRACIAAEERRGVAGLLLATLRERPDEAQVVEARVRGTGFGGEHASRVQAVGNVDAAVHLRGRRVKADRYRSGEVGRARGRGLAGRRCR